MMDPGIFQQKLLDWYRKEARVLPWRTDPAPYKVWISEMMLQQTRVDTVIPYFERFVSEIPSVGDLSETPDDRLLKLWQGLGYYRRAMNLKKAARIMMEQFDGRIPDTVELLKTLPGIGDYSAGAIASIGFGVKTCAVDGNVLRVMARLTADSGNIDDPSVKKRWKAEVQKLLPENGAGDFNQALMDLGATICLPNGAPRCTECPVRPLCEADKAGIASLIPEKIKVRDRRIEQKTVFILVDNGRFALRKREPEGLLANLFEFPHAEGFLSLEECGAMLKEWGISGYDILPAGEARHVFSHLEWHMKGYFVAVRDKKPMAEWIWVSPEEIRLAYSIPTAFKGFMKWLNIPNLKL